MSSADYAKKVPHGASRVIMPATAFVTVKRENGPEETSISPRNRYDTPVAAPLKFRKRAFNFFFNRGVFGRGEKRHGTKDEISENKIIKANLCTLLADEFESDLVDKVLADNHVRLDSSKPLSGRRNCKVIDRTNKLNTENRNHNAKKVDEFLAELKANKSGLFVFTQTAHSSVRPVADQVRLREEFAARAVTGVLKHTEASLRKLAKEMITDFDVQAEKDLNASIEKLMVDANALLPLLQDDVAAFDHTQYSYFRDESLTFRKLAGQALALGPEMPAPGQKRAPKAVADEIGRLADLCHSLRAQKPVSRHGRVLQERLLRLIEERGKVLKEEAAGSGVTPALKQALAILAGDTGANIGSLRGKKQKDYGTLQLAERRQGIMSERGVALFATQRVRLATVGEEQAVHARYVGLLGREQDAGALTLSEKDHVYLYRQAYEQHARERLSNGLHAETDQPSKQEIGAAQLVLDSVPTAPPGQPLPITNPRALLSDLAGAYQRLADTRPESEIGKALRAAGLNLLKAQHETVAHQYFDALLSKGEEILASLVVLGKKERKERGDVGLQCDAIDVFIAEFEGTPANPQLLLELGAPAPPLAEVPPQQAVKDKMLGELRAASTAARANWDISDLKSQINTLVTAWNERPEPSVGLGYKAFRDQVQALRDSLVALEEASGSAPDAFLYLALNSILFELEKRFGAVAPTADAATLPAGLPQGAVPSAPAPAAASARPLSAFDQATGTAQKRVADWKTHDADKPVEVPRGVTARAFYEELLGFQRDVRSATPLPHEEARQLQLLIDLEDYVQAVLKDHPTIKALRMPGRPDPAPVPAARPGAAALQSPPRSAVNPTAGPARNATDLSAPVPSAPVVPPLTVAELRAGVVPLAFEPALQLVERWERDNSALTGAEFHRRLMLARSDVQGATVPPAEKRIQLKLLGLLNHTMTEVAGRYGLARSVGAAGAPAHPTVPLATPGVSAAASGTVSFEDLAQTGEGWLKHWDVEHLSPDGMDAVQFHAQLKVLIARLEQAPTANVEDGYRRVSILARLRTCRSEVEYKFAATLKAAAPVTTPTAGPTLAEAAGWTGMPTSPVSVSPPPVAPSRPLERPVPVAGRAGGATPTPAPTPTAQTPYVNPNLSMTLTGPSGKFEVRRMGATASPTGSQPVAQPVRQPAPQAVPAASRPGTARDVSFDEFASRMDEAINSVMGKLRGMSPADLSAQRLRLAGYMGVIGNQSQFTEHQRAALQDKLQSCIVFLEAEQVLQG